MQKCSGIICLCGNDGTGKSTLANLLPTLFPSYIAIERSLLQKKTYLEAIRQQIRRIDALTYTYSFQNQRSQFEPSATIKDQEGQEIPVYWIMLHLNPVDIFKRIATREDMGIHESKKCVEYYASVYLDIAAFYGMTVVTARDNPNQNCSTIIKMIECGAADEIRKIGLKYLSAELIQSLDIEAQIAQQLTNQFVAKIVTSHFLPSLRENKDTKQFYFPQIEQLLSSSQNKSISKKIAARWISKNIMQNKRQKNQLNFEVNLDQKIFIELKSPSFAQVIEGQSKLIFDLRSKNSVVQQYFADKLWILLKSTIYSHTMQHTGQIQNLGKIRAVGSSLFLEMLRRNNLHHAYISINREGIIFSERVKTNNIEVVFKKQYVGTDKHSYSNLNLDSLLVNKNNQYTGKLYVRFDWRNPNHIIKNNPKFILNMDPYYYVIEKCVGKEHFFELFLKGNKIIPMGDKCISEDLLFNYINTKKVKKAVLSLYCTFTYYCQRVGLEIVDGCFMLDTLGSTVWSQINPDCMRVKKNENNSRQNYDKDIWRIGGSDSKIKILQKWTIFNKLFIDYFLDNRFHQTELLDTTPLFYPQSQEASRLLKNYSSYMSSDYTSALRELSFCTQRERDVIATIDISDGKPMLVKSSELSQNHSENLQKAHSYINLIPKIVLVDLDSALERSKGNINQIKKIVKKANNNIYGVGGGIRSKQIADYYLNELLIPKIILSTNLELLKELPLDVIQKRIIVELSVNENNEVLTHGRKVNTNQNVIKKMIELSRMGVKIVSLTFNHKEGHLNGIPRQQLREIMFKIPGTVDKVIIAGGISSLDDLQYIWGFPKTVPQLGSAIWKKRISISNLCNKIIKFDDNQLCPAIITDSTDKLMGEVFMNQQAINLVCQTRQLHRYSRKLGRVIKKGEQSGNIQLVKAFKIDCDHDCLNIIVEEGTKPFCHLQSHSCFDLSCQNKTHNILSLQNHLLRKKLSGSGYSKKMQQNQAFSLAKFMEESFQFSITKNRIVEEGADVISHMLMYLNSKGISFEEIMKQLQARSIKTKAISLQKTQKKEVYLGVMGGKHFNHIDDAMLKSLGIRVIRAQNRSLKLSYQIQNQEKYDKYFKGLNIKLIGIKSKDMAQFLNKKYISYCFNYSIMMDNYPQIWQKYFYQPIQDIKLVLLQRQSSNIDPKLWRPDLKGKIASEYPRSVVNYLASIGIEESNYSIVQVCGGTQSYLQMKQFDYCDAIVESGRTIQDNNLKIVNVLCQPISAGLYGLKN